MGIFDFLNKSLSSPSIVGAKQILAEIRNETLTEVIKIQVKPRANLKPTNSNFGGIPYLPTGSTIPTNNQGQQLLFLAQINCAELPPNSIYPQQGMMQFWIFNDDLLGMDFDNPISNDTNRVIYYPTIGEHVSEEEFESIYNPNGDEEPYSPIVNGHPFGLSFTLEHEGLSVSDYRFDSLFVSKWNQKYPKHKINNMFDSAFPNEISDFVYDEAYISGHQIGGYPCFTQFDPREKNYKDYNITLLQIDSDWNDNYEIMWGDAGVANFFATDEQMRTLDFTEAFYTWDCG